jgi:hypothetical protein
MPSRLAVERKFFAEHPGEAFDEAWHRGRQQVVAFETELAKLPQFEFPLKHYFADGLYVREIFIPRGAALVGYIHTQECITTVSRGCIVIFDGQNRMTVRAPFTTVVPRGTKKAGYALEDTVWSDAYVNADNEHDLAKLEARLTADTHEDYLRRLENK